MKYKLGVHIFRRDLRLSDNTSLIYSLKHSQQVIPCFILDSGQIDENRYRSDHALQFMINCLFDLNQQLVDRNAHLYLFYGKPDVIIEQLIKTLKVDLVSVNRDYTPYSQIRDKAIAQICKNYNVTFLTHNDALLHEPEQILKSNLEPYTVFSHFFNKARQLSIRTPIKNNYKNFYSQNIKFALDINFLKKIPLKVNKNLFVNGGQSEAISLLSKIKNLAGYEKYRNFPALNYTTHLSAHNKFGTVSIREVYYTIINNLSQNHELIRELYWRDFFTYIIFYFPYVLRGAFQKKYDNIQWNNDKELFRKWCNGKTGFPIVDAGMRQLNQTGYIPNRIRLITASFLVKDLFINWRWGEQYFASKLVDYDPAVNNGNWQWVASTGCDAQPYFRIFNPWLQQKKFDPDCKYIKLWLPELQNLSIQQIHNIGQFKIKNYPSPIVEHKIAAQNAINQFRKI